MRPAGGLSRPSLRSMHSALPTSRAGTTLRRMTPCAGNRASCAYRLGSVLLSATSSSRYSWCPVARLSSQFQAVGFGAAAFPKEGVTKPLDNIDASIPSKYDEGWHIPSANIEWPGLAAWRANHGDKRRQWEGISCIEGPPLMAGSAAAVTLPSSLADCACLVLQTADPLMKAALSHRIWEAQLAAPMPLGSAVPPDAPQRPDLPKLVPPWMIPSAKKSALPLNIYQLHNLAHVELNAVDLAMDTLARFAHLRLPAQFYLDFLHIADDESRHFGWCHQRLVELGSYYGAMPAHELLWDAARLSAGDVSARLALVPLAAEARGLDAAPRLVQRLNSFNDKPSAAIVDLIGLQEKAHVAVGVDWFGRMAASSGQDTGDAFRGWLSALCPDLLGIAHNHAARAEVGMQRDWYDKSLWPPELAGCSDSSSATSRDADLYTVRNRLATFLQDEMPAAGPAKA